VTPPAAKAAKSAPQPVAFEMGDAPAVWTPAAVGSLPGLKSRPEPPPDDPPTGTDPPVVVDPPVISDPPPTPPPANNPPPANDPPSIDPDPGD
jgi:hypothetical protein